MCCKCCGAPPPIEMRKNFDPLSILFLLCYAFTTDQTSLNCSAGMGPGNFAAGGAFPFPCPYIPIVVVLACLQLISPRAKGSEDGAVYIWDSRSTSVALHPLFTLYQLLFCEITDRNHFLLLRIHYGVGAAEKPQLLY